MGKKNGKAEQPETQQPAGSDAVFAPAVETLYGDVRDEILREFKLMQKPWQQMNEDEQGQLIHRADHLADMLVRRAVDLVAERGLPALPIKVGKFTVDGSDIKGTFECYADDDALLRMRHLAGARAMFVLASPDAYSGERKEAEPDVVGDLAMPKDAENEANLQALERTMTRNNAEASANAAA